MKKIKAIFLLLIIGVLVVSVGLNAGTDANCTSLNSNYQDFTPTHEDHIFPRTL